LNAENPAPLPGVAAHQLDLGRLSTRALSAGEGELVLFLHGNLSSATWWEEELLALPPGYRGVAPDLRGFGGADRAALIDARRGVGDWVDDAIALADQLGEERFHVVGHSLGAVVGWGLLARCPGRLASLTAAAPGSPLGFGATRDVSGEPTTPDFAGSGGGLANPELHRLLAAGEAGLAGPFSPRAALRTLIVRPPFVPAREDALVAAMLTTHMGPRAWPGDSGVTWRWPYRTPGDWGPNNALSPRHLDLVGPMLAADPKPPVLWIRGEADLVVSDAAASDPGTWGPAGLIPGYPGPLAYPPQPMLAQTRAVLTAYGQRGGWWREVALPEVGHSPYLEAPAAFRRLLHAHLRGEAA
jgi:pimeloyl-ACP methyl ester carboxylesterase